MSYLLWRISQPNLLIGGRGPAAILGLLGHGLRHLALLPAGVDGIQQPLGWVASPGMFDALALNEGARLLQRSPRVTMADHVPEQRDGKHKGSMGSVAANCFGIRRRQLIEEPAGWPRA
jgi:hypothetical protein